MKIISPVVEIDVHGMHQEEAVAAIEKKLKSAQNGVYRIRVIHGFNRGTRLRQAIYREFKYDDRIRRIEGGGNLGITELILKEY